MKLNQIVSEISGIGERPMPGQQVYGGTASTTIDTNNLRHMMDNISNNLLAASEQLCNIEMKIYGPRPATATNDKNIDAGLLDLAQRMMSQSTGLRNRIEELSGSL